jgi:hypothetical protein
MRLFFDLEEASIVLSALSDMDDFFLPKSVSRKDLYTLINNFVQVMALTNREDGRAPIPNLFQDKFDTSKLVKIDLTQVEMDYVLCALHAMGSEEAGYPENINSAASRVYNKIGGQFIDEVINHPKKYARELIDQEIAINSEL